MPVHNSQHAALARPSSFAFTLIEMLVVISVLAILLALLFPALTGMMEKSKSAKCVSNLRGLMTASLLYANDNDGWLPKSGDSLPPNASVNTLTWWSMKNVLAEYGVGKKSELKICPSDIGSPRSRSAAETSYGIAGPVSWGARHTGEGQPSGPWPKVSGLSRPSRVIVFFEIASHHHGSPPGSQYRPQPPFQAGKVNVAFLDGHVGIYEAPERNAVGGLASDLAYWWWNYRAGGYPGSVAESERVNIPDDQ